MEKDNNVHTHTLESTHHITNPTHACQPRFSLSAAGDKRGCESIHSGKFHNIIWTDFVEISVDLNTQPSERESEKKNPTTTKKISYTLSVIIKFTIKAQPREKVTFFASLHFRHAIKTPLQNPISQGKFPQPFCCVAGCCCWQAGGG